MPKGQDSHTAQTVFQHKLREYFEEIDLRRKARAADLDPDLCTLDEAKAAGLPKLPTMKSLMASLQRDVTEAAHNAGTTWDPPEDVG